MNAGFRRRSQIFGSDINANHPFREENDRTRQLSLLTSEATPLATRRWTADIVESSLHGRNRNPVERKRP